VTIAGASRCRRLSPGATFAIDGAATFEGELAVVHIAHTGSNVANAGDRYDNRFECVPSSVFAAPAPAARRIVQVVESAVVVGPVGKEIETDVHGRVRVQFHWDRQGRNDERSSCWLRVMQAWSGPSYGFQFVPRIGMEVLVSFLGGDPDRPVVIGCLPNRVNLLPHHLPEYQTISAIRTHSTPGGVGYNEIKFDDAKGAEQIVTHAERDQIEIVLHDHQSTVGNDRRSTVDRDRALIVGRDDAVTIGGRSDTTIALDRREVVGAGTTEEIGGSRRVDVGGSTTLTASDATTTLKHDYALNVGADYRLFVGGHDAPGHMTIHSTGGGMVHGDTVRVTADKGIKLACHDSVVDITPEGVTIRAKHLNFVGTEDTKIRGKTSQVLLADEAEMRSMVVRLHSALASVTLTATALIRGVAVTLVEAPDPLALTKDEPPQPDERVLELQLTDELFEPFANKVYRLQIGDKTIDGRTGADGKVKVKTKAKEAAASLTLWLGEYPTGQTRTWTIAIQDDLPPANTVRGALMRLRGLGYHLGGVAEELDADSRLAIQGFQHDQRLAITGEIDAATAAALEGLAGH
jgi:type VI secretion system secreted protein VgrG